MNSMRRDMPDEVKKGAVVFATLFGIGYCPFAPGTLGTLAALIVCFFLPTNSLIYIVWIAAVTAVSIPISYAAEQYFLVEDDRRIIIDELAGYMVAVAFIPKTWIYFLAAFILFRIFDIFKISFIRKSQTLPWGIGIVVDDLLAGLVSNFILQITRLILNNLI